MTTRTQHYGRRQLGVLIAVGAALLIGWLMTTYPMERYAVSSSEVTRLFGRDTAAAALEKLAVKGRAPKTGYARTEFGNGWARNGDCDTRNRILARDLAQPVVGDGCKVVSGKLTDPYTGATIQFKRGVTSSAAVQIDHVVALSNAWQTGAQQLSRAQREALANDPLNLLAVDGAANQAKGDGDAATWLPSHKAFRCQYVMRQIAVKRRYQLWVTEAEKTAMQRVLRSCDVAPR